MPALVVRVATVVPLPLPLPPLRVPDGAGAGARAPRVGEEWAGRPVGGAAAPSTLVGAPSAGASAKRVVEVGVEARVEVGSASSATTACALKNWNVRGQAGVRMGGGVVSRTWVCGPRSALPAQGEEWAAEGELAGARGAQSEPGRMRVSGAGVASEVAGGARA